ncbi:MAG TPA: hypothetical protein VF908_10415, partial [Gemmatimonadaceae bacterium]
WPSDASDAAVVPDLHAMSPVYSSPYSVEQGISSPASGRVRTIGKHLDLVETAAIADAESLDRSG